ncbi:major facilitator superfamily transporter [Tritrichomonas foetus]|uniref:Lysosomal dipeptide transporter MFSD1 n=1 Tax=Tritrichomonas foetus TaxID=1144522 RepID=A0A1J4JEW8_9EUKA|nr:major facilitator superfamily transporter [Tritrichomonas foetus]|eukprot:OHS96187.1 major facilitator superfamily transporter [Tritrichomonas foetus]
MVRVNCVPKWVMQGVILVLGCLAYALTFFHRYAPSVLYQRIAETLGVSTDQISTFGSMYFWPYAVMQPVGGILADIFSPGKLIAVSTLCISLGATIDGFSTNFGLSSFGRFLVGLGAGPIFVPASRLIASWFSDRGFVIASGVLLAAGSAGGLVAQGPLAAAVEGRPWQNAFYIAAGIGVVVAVLSMIFLKSTPKYAGYDDEENTKTDEVKDLSLKAQMIQLWENIKIVMANPQFWIVAIWGICSPSCFFNVSSLWAGPYLRDVCKLSDNKANTYIMMLSVAWIVGGPVFPFISELLKTRKWLIFACACISCATSIGFMFVTENTPDCLLLTMLFVFALCAGSAIGVENSMYKEMHIPSAGGTGMGCGNFFPFIVSGFLQLASPSILYAIDGQSQHHTYQAYKYGIWMVNACMTFIAAFGIFLARDTHGLKPHEKAGYVDKSPLFSPIA